MMRSTRRPAFQFTAWLEPTLALGLLLASGLLLRQSLPAASRTFDGLLVVLRLGVTCLGRPHQICDPSR